MTDVQIRRRHFIRNLIVWLLGLMAFLGIIAEAGAWVPYEAAIRDAAARHGTSAEWLIDVMMCESGGDPHAVNPRTGDSGLFQYQPSTFHTFSSMSGIHGDLWNPYVQIELTAWAFANGYADHWVCSGVWDGSPS